jgi:biopolymer transport protein ExbD
MDASGPRPKVRSAINVTPLIDVVLVLLIVFIVMIPSLTRMLQVTVPKATLVPVKPDPANPPVVVTVRKAAAAPGWEYLLQRETVPLQELADRLTPVVLRQAPGLRRVYLKVDGELPFQAAVDALDQVRLASDRARAATQAKGGPDGGEVKVAISQRNP